MHPSSALLHHDSPCSIPTVEGVLRGFDRTLNVILDEAVEHIDGMYHRRHAPLHFRHPATTHHTPPTMHYAPTAPDKPAGSTRKLGFVIARGSNVTLVTPAAERKAIDNPF